MTLRNIVKIDPEKCNGCGLCVNACAEGAIQLIDGKAKLVSDIYCDGLGACLGHCPQDAITIEQREAPDFDEKATHEYLAKMKAAAKPAAPSPADSGFVCPGMRAQQFAKKTTPAAAPSAASAESQLAQWPIQLKLVSPQAPYFAGADILLAADCVPFAMADFHSTLLAGKAIVVFCPKLDDCGTYTEKLAQIIRHNKPASITTVHMEVPCCTGVVRIAQMAKQQAESDLPINDITISLQGQIINRQTL